MKSFFLLFILFTSSAFGAESISIVASSKFPKDTAVLETLKTKSFTNVIVSVTENNIAGLQQEFEVLLGQGSFSTRAHRATTYYTMLKEHADSTQASIMGTLNELKIKKTSKSRFLDIRQLWITNEIIVKGADYETCKTLLAMDQVSGVREERMVPLMDYPAPDSGIELDDYDYETFPPPNNGSGTGNVTWGVDFIQATQCWSRGADGTGIVVANIDTGVQCTHECLKGNFRGGNYSWFDPYMGTALPNDQNGHGTHTMGTIAGTNGVGVAKGAKWIACKGCSMESCSETSLLKCGQWVACPTQSDGTGEDCSQAPQVVSCSWGQSDGGDEWYDNVCKSWTYLGICHFFAAGNNGPNCSTIGYPADSPDTHAIAACDQDGNVPFWSSRGQTVRGARPGTAYTAPGVGILSAYYVANNSYYMQDGTSMATPHVSGCCALLRSKYPNLPVDQYYSAIQAGCSKNPSQNSMVCGPYSGTSPQDPFRGWGTVNCDVSLQQLESTAALSTVNPTIVNATTTLPPNATTIVLTNATTMTMSNSTTTVVTPNVTTTPSPNTTTIMTPIATTTIVTLNSTTTVVTPNATTIFTPNTTTMTTPNVTTTVNISNSTTTPSPNATTTPSPNATTVVTPNTTTMTTPIGTTTVATLNSTTTVVTPNATTTPSPNATTIVTPITTTMTTPNVTVTVLTSNSTTTVLTPNATTPSPNATTTPSPNATTTPSPNATTTPSPNATTTPSPNAPTVVTSNMTTMTTPIALTVVTLNSTTTVVTPNATTTPSPNATTMTTPTATTAMVTLNATTVVTPNATTTSSPNATTIVTPITTTMTTPNVTTTVLTSNSTTTVLTPNATTIAAAIAATTATQNTTIMTTTTSMPNATTATAMTTSMANVTATMVVN